MFKELISKIQPELNLNTPLLMFYSETLDKLYKDFLDENITVREIVNMPSSRVFNFVDNEKNCFAVMKQK